MIEHQRQTCLETYGVPNPTQSPAVQTKIQETVRQRYGTNCVLQSPAIKQNSRNIIRSKYGVDNPFSSKLIQDKIKSTNLEKYGVPNPLKNQEIQAKREATSLAKYGCRSPSEHITIRAKIQTAHMSKPEADKEAINEKRKKTSLERYGVPSTNQLPSVQEKKIATSLDKYGVEYPNQSPLIQEKNQNCGFRRKEFVMPSGAIRIVQGYEPFALKELLTTYTEDQIVTERKAIPRIAYTANGKQRYYFPDIYIPHEQRIIEVKSTWTYSCATDTIYQKAEATRAAGYTYDLFIYNAKGERITPKT
jgi:hypothetical protein